ncbi:hypothetical protein LshimejAT787_2301020 [Lyophyllum shimeji]|uniref:FIST domain-containing protein n=1 Tax=Lyophyllum shimeji TaxID=47721 RepID=A0A9P3Q2C8_LYOSH|nr:hypothetical protein LshimejAT787_2301020 [Lyophyllum shimeji]
MQTCTLLTRSPSALVSHLSQLSKSFADHTLLFALSPNVPPADLSNLVTRLTTFSPTTLGCLSAPLPNQNRIACSLALFPSSSAVPFRSTIPGRPTPQVGRWHAFRKKDHDDVPSAPQGELSWSEVWNRNAGGVALPPALQDLNPDYVNEVVYLTDRAPEGLVNALAEFPRATKLGLIAASTPFITGRPVTLFHNDNIYDSGAVGLAFRRAPGASAQTEFSGVLPISPVMTVTDCEGNMLNALDDTNPTQLLLDAIRKTGIAMDASQSFKDEETFLLGVVPNAAEPQQMYSITAGDPWRGNISLASQNAPAVGTQVQVCAPIHLMANSEIRPSWQFFHRPKSAKVEVPMTRPRSNDTSALRFLACAEIPFDSVEVGDGEVEVLQDAFIAASENGFVLGRPNEDTWTCIVPGGVASLEWPRLTEH